MLASFLRSVDDSYKIEFRTDAERRLLIVKVTKEFLYKEVYIAFELLSDEDSIVRAIRNTITLMEDVYEHK